MHYPPTWSGPDPRALFFDKFREALARLPAGLIRPGPAASPEEIASVSRALARTLPQSYVSFLTSFDGADLFHEAVLLAGVGRASPRRLIEINDRSRGSDELVFAEAAGGDRFALRGDGAVLRIRAESSEEPTERWIAGGDFARWLDGVIAYHKVLYGPDGEFAAEVFEPDGSEVLPVTVLKQTERALRACPDSAEWHHERGVALRRLGRFAQAKDAFATAATLDPLNPWPQFDRGRVALQLGSGAAREAGAAFETAALLEHGDAAGRLWVWAARAAIAEGAPERLQECRRQALACEPPLAAQLGRARDAAQLDGDPDEIAEAEALLAALEGPVPTGRARLTVLGAESATAGSPKVSGAAAVPARPPLPPARRRPPRAAPQPSGAPKPGSRR